MGLEGKRVAILVEDQYQMHEFWYPFYRFQEAGAEVIPGGYAPDMMRRSPEMVAFVHDMDAAGKPVAAICHAGWMLVSAKVVKGRRATCFYSIRDDLEAAGAQWSDEPVVVDGNLITSRVPG